MDDERELRELDRILDALEEDRADDALRLVQRAVREPGPADPVLHFLAGRALLELDRVPEALEHLLRAVDLDPDDPDYRSELALAFYRSCRFEEARAHLDVVLATDPDRPDDVELDGRLLERLGRFDEADLRYRRVHEMDGERFPVPVRLSLDAFHATVAEAAERLPAEFREHLDRVAVTVEDLPSDEILRDDEPPLDPDVLGLFVGVPLPEKTHHGPGGELPPRILLFRRNLERIVADEDVLRDEIAVTLYHELGHYLGLDEDELSEIDLD
jgi:predicted Zn-dependent protease with MMP-like domain